MNIQGSPIKNLETTYQIGQLVGSGSYGQVFEAIDKANNKKVAIKVVPLKQDYSEELVELMRAEGVLLESLAKVPNPNIINLVEYFESDNTIFIVTEFCQTNLMKLLIPFLNTRTLSRQSADKLFWQMVNAVSHLHIHQNYIHRDLKYANFLLQTKNEEIWATFQESQKSTHDLDILINNSVLKLIDFGLSASLDDGSRHTFCGTLSTMAPEVLLKMGYDYGADVFSLGILYHDMIYFRKYIASRPPRDNELLMRMLLDDRKQRITMSQLYELRNQNKNEKGEIQIIRKKNTKIQVLLSEVL